MLENFEVIKKINKYIAFSDESNYNKGKYRSVSLVVLHETEFNQINNKLNFILNKYGLNIKTFKWNNLKSNSKLIALKELLTYLFGLMLDGSLRIHVIIWDIEDSRHDVVGRDDITNLSMMYYKLIKNFVKDNLYDKETLTIYADRNDALDWENLEDIFLNDGVFNIAADGLITLMDKKVFFTESNTKENPLIQIADIFAYTQATSNLKPAIADFLKLMCLFILFVPFGATACNIFQGVGKGNFSLILTIIREFALVLIFSYLLGFIFKMGIFGLYSGMLLGGCIGTFIAYIAVEYYIKLLIKKKNHEDS